MYIKGFAWPTPDRKLLSYQCKMRQGFIVQFVLMHYFLYVEKKTKTLQRNTHFCRRSGQRSRVRKLQYIADLERTVDSLQNMGADLAVRVASHFQLRNALSMENKQLRRQIASLQQAKLMKDGQTHFLKKETERLKQISVRHRRSRSVTSCFEPGSIGADPSAINWQTLDMSNLSLNGSPVPVPPRGGYGL